MHHAPCALPYALCALRSAHPPSTEHRMPKAGCINPQPATRTPQPATRNPHPATRNPQPATRKDL